MSDQWRDSWHVKSQRGVNEQLRTFQHHVLSKKQDWDDLLKGEQYITSDCPPLQISQALNSELHLSCGTSTVHFLRTRNFLHSLVITATEVCVLVVTVEVDVTVFLVLVNWLVVVLGVTRVDCCELSDAHGGCDVMTMLLLCTARKGEHVLFFVFFRSKKNITVNTLLREIQGVCSRAPTLNSYWRSVLYVKALGQ